MKGVIEGSPVLKSLGESLKGRDLIHVAGGGRGVEKLEMSANEGQRIVAGMEMRHEVEGDAMRERGRDEPKGEAFDRGRQDLLQHAAKRVVLEVERPHGPATNSSEITTNYAKERAKGTGCQDRGLDAQVGESSRRLKKRLHIQGESVPVRELALHGGGWWTGGSPFPRR